MIKKILLLVLLVPCLVFSQQNNTKKDKKITGFIRFEDKPLPYVTINTKENNNSTFTNSKGYFEINIEVGNTLVFTYVGLKNIEIAIEDVTETLNFNMVTEDKFYHLDENKSLKLGGGTIGSRTAKLNATIIDVTSLNKNALSLSQAILEKVPFLKAKQNMFGENLLYVKGQELDGPVIWNIDDFIFDIPIPIFISEVKNITVVTGLHNNCAINVKTNINYKKVKDLNFDNYYFTDDDFYNNDAIKYKSLKRFKPDYLKALENVKKIDSFLVAYEKLLPIYKNEPQFYSHIINLFSSKKKYNDLILKVLKDYENSISNNPEELKSIAYKYQELNKNEAALSIFKKVANLRPNYKQSYRDLANTYLDLKKYDKFWLIYNLYLSKGFQIENDDIGELMISEISTAYNATPENVSNKRIKVNNPNKLIKSDVRLVFEWNTTDADFKIEFVNPEKHCYEIENSVYKSNALINDQKRKGYSSKEILIQKLRPGNWLVNFTYLGNKQYKPTTLKITTYQNWGRKNQTKKVNVFEFILADKKTQLLKL